jgi:hypothetical protein
MMFCIFSSFSFAGRHQRRPFVLTPHTQSATKGPSWTADEKPKRKEKEKGRTDAMQGCAASGQQAWRDSGQDEDGRRKEAVRASYSEL